MYLGLGRRDFPAVLRDQGSSEIGVTLALHARFEGATCALCLFSRSHSPESKTKIGVTMHF